MSVHQLPRPVTAPPPLLGPASVCEIGQRCTQVAVVAVSNGFACRSRRSCEECLPDAVLTEAVDPGEPVRLTVVRLG